MYRLSIQTGTNLFQTYHHVSDETASIILGKRYQDLPVDGNLRTIHITYATLAQSIGLRDVVYDNMFYTDSLISLWKHGRITSSKVDILGIAPERIRGLFERDIETDIMPGEYMLKQMILTQSEVSVSFTFQIAKWVPVGTLKQLKLRSVSRYDVYLYEYLMDVEQTTQNSMLGPTGPYAALGDIEIVRDPRKYCSGSVIPYFQCYTRYYPFRIDIDRNKAMLWVEAMRSDPKYMTVLADLESKVFP